MSTKPDADVPNESNLNKAQKFVRFLELLQVNDGVTAADMMTRFGLDDRTLRRYLSDLRDLNLPIHSEGRGANRRLWIDPSYRRQGVQLSLLELVSLHFGRTLFNFLEGTGFAQDMDDALERLSTLAGDRSAQLAEDLERKFMAVPEHAKDHTRTAEIVDDILSALLYQNPARAFYARLTGPTRQYVLHPYTLVTFRQGLYLFALDVESDKIKTYAIDRFRAFERVRNEHFELPEDYDPQALVRDAFGIIGGQVKDVVLSFRRSTAPYIRERIWHRSQVMEADRDGGLILRMRVGISPELVNWIMSFGPGVKVHSPPELADQVRRLHKEAIGVHDS
ncbi:MAG: transcriptional regulator [Myxococcota bacterium]